MRSFVIIASIHSHGRVEFGTDVRMVVRADSLRDAYHAVRMIPGFRHAHLRPE